MNRQSHTRSAPNSPRRRPSPNVGRPNESMQAGFDMDFYLDWRWDGHPTLSPQSFVVLG